jgi:hypothetical protein
MCFETISEQLGNYYGFLKFDLLFGLIEFLATDPEVRVRFPALPDCLRSSESGTGSIQPHEYN